MTAIYERQEGESSRAYAAFCAYRDMGAGRSLMKAWRQQSGNEKATSVPGGWTEWNEKNDWKKRAEAFDSDEDKRRRSEAAELHRQEVEAYRIRVIEGAQQRADASNAFLKAALDVLKTVDLSKVSPTALPRFLEAAMTVWEKSVNLEGVALGVLDESGKPLEAGQ